MMQKYLLALLALAFVACAPASNQSESTSWVHSALYASPSASRKACDKAADDVKRKVRDETYGTVEVKLEKGGFTFVSSLATTYTYCFRYFDLGGEKLDAPVGKPFVSVRDAIPEKLSLALIGSDFLKIAELTTQEVASTSDLKSYSLTTPTPQQVNAMDKADSIEVRLKFGGVDQWKLLTRDMFKGGV